MYTQDNMNTRSYIVPCFLFDHVSMCSSRLSSAMCRTTQLLPESFRWPLYLTDATTLSLPRCMVSRMTVSLSGGSLSIPFIAAGQGMSLAGWR